MNCQSIKIAISGKGGVGKTTLSGTLARLFARDGYKVIAIDTDPDMNLHCAIGIKENPKPLSELKELIEERVGGTGGIYKLNPKVDDIVDNYSVTSSDGVKMLVMGTIEKGGSGCICPESAFLKAFLRYVFKTDYVVILDMEAGIEHLGRGTAKGVDLMIVVVEQGLQSIETAMRIKNLSGDIGIKKLFAVINKVTDMDKISIIENKLKEIGIPVIGKIPFDSNLINADLNGVAPIELDSSAIDTIKEIYKVVSIEK
ncbi:MAG: AAA family ATPase [Methanosarcinales archaeon]